MMRFVWLALAWGVATAQAQTCVPDIFFSTTGCCTTIKSEYNLSESAVQAQMVVSDAATAAALRKRIIQYVFKQDTLPTTTPTVTADIVDPMGWTTPTTVDQIDQWQIVMSSPEGNLTTNMILYRPNPERKTRLFIMANGHANSIEAGRTDDIIQALLARNYAVLFVNMPGYTPNVAPFDPTSGSPFPVLHDPFHIDNYEGPSQSTWDYFLRPFVAAVNYALNTAGYKTIYMTGLSGGGWTTTVYSAIDPRIQRTVEMAGSNPFFLRGLPCNATGDHEQYPDSRPAWVVANDYLDLYVLGAFDNAWRRRLQVLNQYDDCCFWGITYTVYDNVIEDIIETDIGAGGQISYILDSSEGLHQYPAAQDAAILAWFGE